MRMQSAHVGRNNHTRQPQVYQSNTNPTNHFHMHLNNPSDSPETINNANQSSELGGGLAISRTTDGV
jgi:hypothetical protein